MTTTDQTAAEILRQMAASILRDQENQVQDVRRQVRQCEQMIALAKKELEHSEATS